MLGPTSSMLHTRAIDLFCVQEKIFRGFLPYMGWRPSWSCDHLTCVINLLPSIYTDGSNEDSKVGCAVISDNHSNMQRIPDDSSIFTAEAKAIYLALDFISTCDAYNKFIIFSDSLSVLKAMNHTSSKNQQIQKLLEKSHDILAYKEIALCWIPSHIGIQGNEMVDKQAKTSLSIEPTSFKIPFSNFKPSINKYILEEWQTSWNNSIGNKLLDIKPTNYW